MIDGRAMGEPGPHGSREMPVWGQRFREDAQQTRTGRWKPERKVRERLVTLGITASPGGPERFGRDMARDLARYGQVVKAANIRAE